MREKTSIIVGLDIGTTKTVAVAGMKTKDGKIQVLSIGRSDVSGVSNGSILNIEHCVQSIKQAISGCNVCSNPLEVKMVYSGISGQHLKHLQTRGERMRNNPDDEICQQDVELLICDQHKTHLSAGTEIIDIIPQEFFVDNKHCVLNPVGMSGMKLAANFHIVTGEKSAVKNLKRCIEKNELNIKQIMLNSLASASAVINEEDIEAGVIVLDVGAGITDMTVFQDGVLKHTATIPYAGDHITNDIRNELGILKAQAEQIKTEYGSALADEINEADVIVLPGLHGFPPKEISVRLLSTIIQARMQELFDHVLYELKKLGLEKRLHGGIILTGGGAQMKNVAKFVQQATGLGVRIGQPTEHLANDYNDVLSKPEYATAVGLMLLGHEDHEKNSKELQVEMGNMFLYEDKLIVPEPAVQQPIVLEPVINSTINTVEISEEHTEIEQNIKSNKGFKVLLEGVKGKFIRFFEPVEEEMIS